jgi:hypothetical protein
VSSDQRAEAKEEPKDNILAALPKPPPKKVDPFNDLYGDLPPPTNTVVRKPAPVVTKKVKLDPSRVIFLDVDGVLRPAAPGGSSTVFVDGEMVPWVGGGSDFLSSSMRALKWLVDETGARIVLSTEWRRHEALFNSVNQKLQEHGMPVCREGSDTTPLHGPLNMAADHEGLMKQFAVRRVLEIDEWLSYHKEVTHWTAIDDIDLRMCKDPPKRCENLVHNFILTNDQMGFTMKNAQRGKAILRPS